MKNLVWVAVLGLLVACSPQTPPITAPSATVIEAPKATGAPSDAAVVNRGVAVAEQTLTALMVAAKQYTDLPRCGTGPVICSDRETVRKIRRYAIQGHNALLAARRNEAMVGPLWNAIGLLKSVLPST